MYIYEIYNLICGVQEMIGSVYIQVWNLSGGGGRPAYLGPAKDIWLANILKIEYIEKNLKDFIEID